MEHLIETIEKFLAYSDDKLEELAKENQALREENHHSSQNKPASKATRQPSPRVIPTTAQRRFAFFASLTEIRLIDYPVRKCTIQALCAR